MFIKSYIENRSLRWSLFGDGLFCKYYNIERGQDHAVGLETNFLKIFQKFIQKFI